LRSWYYRPLYCELQDAWGKSAGADGKVRMLADTNVGNLSLFGITIWYHIAFHPNAGATYEGARSGTGPHSQAWERSMQKILCSG
jgi:hypothetical protein